jgi:nucleotide-binding universal stress UspA family protein
MFRAITVPLDGSPFAEQAFPLALSIARRSGARLDLVRVHVLYAFQDPTCGWLRHYDLQEEQESKRHDQVYLDATAGWLTAVSPVPTTSAVLEGWEAEPIVRRISESNPDLVVMATHARGAVGRFFFGGMADELIRHVSVPVLVVPTHEPAGTPRLLPEPDFANVVICLDGSSLAEQVVGPAQELARLLESRCTLLRVVPTPEEEEEARDYLTRLADRAAQPGLTLSPRVVVARHAAEAIRAQANEKGGTLLALATHGRGGVGRLLLGSVAGSVVRGIFSPVLVYRPVAPEPVRSAVPVEAISVC